MRNLLSFITVSCSAGTKSPNEDVDSKSTPKLVRRSDLPVYSEPPTFTQKDIEETANVAVLDTVKRFRKEACNVVQTAYSVADRCEKFVNTGIAHSYGSYINAVDYLREDKNVFPRIAAVAAGAFVGHIISIKKGFFRRLLYTSTGGIIVMSLCYPSESEEAFNTTLLSAKKYTIIGYHFLNGVTKDLAGFELPGFPLKLLNSEETLKKETKTE